MDGKELFSQIASLKDNIKRYLETKSSYYGMLIFEKAARGLSLFLASAFTLMAGLLALLFLSGAVAIYMGQALGSPLYGMLVVAGIYFLLMIILLSAKKRIFGRMAIRIVKKFFVNDEGKADDPRS